MNNLELILKNQEIIIRFSEVANRFTQVMNNIIIKNNIDSNNGPEIIALIHEIFSEMSEQDKNDLLTCLVFTAYQNNQEC